MAQDISGTDLAASFASSVQTIARKIEVQWDGVNWVDETARCLSLSWNHALYESVHGLPVLGRGVLSTANVVADNSDKRFSPDNASSPIHAHISDGIYRVPIRINSGYGADLLRQFTGLIEEALEQEAPGSTRVTFRCQDLGVTISQKRHRSTLYTDQRVDQVIETLLSAGGITSHDLDVAMSQIPYAWVNDEILLDEISKLSQSDGAMIHFSKDGEFRFWRMSALLERSDSVTSVIALTRGTCTMLHDAISWRNVYDGIVVETAPRYEGAETTIYEAASPIVVPPGETVVHNAQYRYPASSVVTPTVAADDYRVLSSGGVNLSGDVSLDFSGYAQQADLTFENTNGYHAAFVLGLLIRGRPLLGEESQQQRVAGDKILDVRGNPYVQTRAQQSRLKAFLNDRLKEPRRLWMYSGPLCPWLELGDRVTVQSSPQGIDADAWVVGIRGAADRSALLGQLTLLPCAGVYPHTDYFILGSSSYADTGSNKVFY